jgi:cupin 2 domain-containing protein
MTHFSHGSLFRNLPDAAQGERFEELSQSRSFRIERITSSGQSSPPGFWFDQARDEWVLVVQGEAAVRLQDPGETIHLGAGDWLMIDAPQAQSRSDFAGTRRNLAGGAWVRAERTGLIAWPASA